MNKYYYRPNHIIDVHHVFFRLDEAELSILRIPRIASMLYDHQAFDHLNDFVEIYSGEEFTKLCEKHASKESMEKFKEDFYNLYLKDGNTLPCEPNIDLSEFKSWEPT